jgi:5-methylcytosine-specific restriction endonuclease McrA
MSVHALLTPAQLERKLALQRIYSAEYDAIHKDVKREYDRQYREEHPEKRQAAQKAWRAANRSKTRAYKQQRRAQIKGGLVEDFTDIEIFERDHWICGICGEMIDSVIGYPDSLSPFLDHIVPLTKGGNHTRDNCQASHLRCNISKGNRLLENTQRRV